MATLLLSAVGAGVGQALGSTAFGMSMAGIGQFVGATYGRAIDTQLFSQGAAPIQQDHVEHFRLTGAGEGAPIPYVLGRVRVPGHIIWASHFTEDVDVTGGTAGSKGMPPQPAVHSYRYSVSLAVALCQGAISGVSRVWADGVEIPLDTLNMRVHLGTPDQNADPTIEAIEGTGQAPAYRDLAYVVFDDLQLAQFGNRIPQFSFEVCRQTTGADKTLAKLTKAVHLENAGMYGFATQALEITQSGRKSSPNIHSPSGLSDMETSLRALQQDLPNAAWVSVAPEWFGDDLRCSNIKISPRISEFDTNATPKAWSVSGQTTAQSASNPQTRGTTADFALVQGITHLMQAGQSVLVAPKLSLDISPDNTNPSPVNPDGFQKTHATALDITCSKARGVIGSPDRTQAIKAEVDHFFGTAAESDFNVTGTNVVYAGAADDFGYRRFILHYAHLCAAAGGVSAFLIGSDLAGLTQLRDDQGRFIAVDSLAQLARDVRAILGPQVKLGYAADWREYGAYVPSDAPEDMYFPLDTLWAEPAMNFVGVNARIPLADWRDGDTHLDRAWQSPENPDYLQSNIEGGEGYAWHYPTFEDRTRQNRVDLIDTAHNEHWAIRPKDIKGWWRHTHHERINGIRQTRGTLWTAQSKPIWLLNVGCAAVDKGANDPATPAPWFSTGLRDDSMQYAYAQCLLDYWNDSEKNPMSESYDEPMIDTDAVFVTHWDARPYPWYPSAQGAWTDAARHETGYTLNGRASHVPLSTAVEEVCTLSGLSWPRTDRLWGIIRGYQMRAPDTGRAILQPLAAALGFDAVEQNGTVQFIPRRGQVPTMINRTEVVASDETSGDIETMRSSAAEITGRVQVLFEEADADFSPISEEVVLPFGDQQSVSRQELPMVLSRSEARQIIETWLAEAHLSRETCRFALPPSQTDIAAGSLLSFADAPDVTYRVDRVERGEYLMIDATRHDPNVRQVSPPISTATHVTPYVPPLSVDVTFLDLPILKSDQIAHAPYVVATGDPWPGPIAVYGADEGADFEHLAILTSRATKGVLTSSLPAGVHSRLQHGQSFDVTMSSGQLHSVSMLQMLNGANTAAIGNASLNQWEIIQFQSVELLSTNTYRLANLVRGKFGSHAEDHEGWAEGADFVLLHAGIDQLPMSEEIRTAQRTYRFGPSGRAYNHPSYREEIRDFSARGLRPLSPCHLRWQEIAEGWKITWIRRGRLDADTWEGVDIPLGEESEQYRLRVLRDGQEVMEFTTTTPQAIISNAQITTHDLDLQDRHISIEVAQISNAYGPGIATALEIG